jgi:hypothetical protein
MSHPKIENINFYPIVNATYNHKCIVKKNKGHIHTKFKNPCKKGFKFVMLHNSLGVLHWIKKHDLTFISYQTFQTHQNFQKFQNALETW